MAYDLATVTSSGNQLLASLVPDKSSLVIDKIEVSNTQLASSTDLKSMTSISNVVKTLSANGCQKKDNSFIISTVLDNSSVKVDYQAWVFGIWAHKADGGSSVLMSVITSTNSPDTISKGSGTPIDYNYKFVTTFSNTKSLTIQMSSDTYATNYTVLHNSGDETATGTKTFQKIKISNNKFPNLVQTDGQYITFNGGNTEILPADNSKVVHKTGTEEIGGQKTFDIAPIDKTTGNPYITKDGVPSLPSDIARTGQANTFSPLQTFSQGVKTLQTGSYDDANSLVNEGLYYNTNSSIKNGAESPATGYIQVMSGYGRIVRQIMYSDTDGGVIYDRTSQDGGSSWSNWVQIATFDQIPGDIALTDQDTNFTSKLQHNGQDVALANNTIYRNPNTSGVADNVNFTGTVQKSGSDVITQANWVESDSDTNAQSSSTSDAEGFYYTKEKS